MRVIVDANVLISAIALQPSRVTPIVEHVFQYHDFFMTKQIADELARHTIRIRPHMGPKVQEFLNRQELVWIEETDEKIQILHQDTSDQPILNASIQNGVDIIISGDKGFHALDIDHPRVIWPANYMSEFMD